MYYIIHYRSNNLVIALATVLSNSMFIQWSCIAASSWPCDSLLVLQGFTHLAPDLANPAC